MHCWGFIKLALSCTNADKLNHMEIEVVSSWNAVMSSPLKAIRKIWAPAADGLWSVIVPVAWPLTGRLNRWSPSTGGGNESGLRSLLLSAPSNTLLVPPSTYLGHLTPFDVSGASGGYVCENVCIREPKPQLFKTTEWSTAVRFCWNQLPLILSLADLMLWSGRVSETLRDSQLSCSTSLSVEPPWLIRINRGLDKVT